MDYLFQFEQENYPALQRIPMAVRLKLDLCGVKLTLRDWSKFSRAEREQLLTMPCASPAHIAAFERRLQSLIAAGGGAPAPAVAIDPDWAWKISSEVPAAVRSALAELALPTPEQWAALDELQRFALITLTRTGHENQNLRHALREFRLT